MAFLEIWLRDEVGEYVKQVSGAETQSGFHPHITLVRPFKLPVDPVDQNLVKEAVVEICQGLDGRELEFWLGEDRLIGSEDTKFEVLKVTPNDKLIELDDSLEAGLQEIVKFNLKSESKNCGTRHFCLDMIRKKFEELGQKFRILLLLLMTISGLAIILLLVKH